MIYEELWRLPIEIDIKIRMVSFWARLYRGKKQNSRTYHINLYTRSLLKKFKITFR